MLTPKAQEWITTGRPAKFTDADWESLIAHQMHLDRMERLHTEIDLLADVLNEQFDLKFPEGI